MTPGPMSSSEGPVVNGSRQTGVPAWTTYPETLAAVVIWKIAPPCIALLGGFGNVANIFVMRRIKDHNSSQYAILTALAVCDLILLSTATTGGWLRNVFGVDIQTVHGAACKLVEWVIYASNTTAAWLVTCVTAQRTMAVLWPHRVRVMCTVRRTWIVIVTLVLTSGALNFHLLLGMEVSQGNRCFPMPGRYSYFLAVVFSWVDLGVSSIAPSACLCVCNVTLSVTLFKAVSSSSLVARADSNTDSRKKISYRTTAMVLAISCAFLVLTLPMCAYVIWFSFSTADMRRQPKTRAMAVFLRTVAFQLWYANSAVNFLFYCLTGSKFRREFMRWIRCGAQSPSAPSVHETASEASRGG